MGVSQMRIRIHSTFAIQINRNLISVGLQLEAQRVATAFVRLLGMDRSFSCGPPLLSKVVALEQFIVTAIGCSITASTKLSDSWGIGSCASILCRLSAFKVCLRLARVSKVPIQPIAIQRPVISPNGLLAKPCFVSRIRHIFTFNGR
jgi:hypothetical protein